MSKFPITSILVYPSAQVDQKSFKVNSEKNLSGLARGGYRNKVISGLGITISSGNALINKGKCVISGYQIDIKESFSFASLSGYTSNGKYWVYLSLSRIPSGDMNLQGVSGDVYNGININIDQDTSGFTIPEEDTLTIGYLNKSGSSWTYSSLVRSTTNLRAQDVYVEGVSWAGGTSTPVSDDPAPNNEGRCKTNYLTSSGTLDEVLANFIISDGQFN